MATYGQRKSASTIGKGYVHDPMYEFAKQFRDISQDILTESGYDIFDDPTRTMKNTNAIETLKNFFVNETCDRSLMTESEYEDHVNDMTELFTNDREALLEYTNLADKNPVIGMSFAIHKNILITCPFDKGAIQKAVAASPKFTVDLETRLLICPDGTEIDMWKDQNKMTAAIDATVPYSDVIISLPENETTDVLAAIGGSHKDNLSIETYITEVLVELDNAGVKTDTWIKVKPLRFVPGYGEYDRVLYKKVVLPAGAAGTEDTITGTMHKNKFNINSMRGLVKKVKIHARRDSSNGLVDTCQVSWKVKSDIVEIPENVPINVPISPEEVKDIAALYQVNQLTKVMSLIKTTMENYKDDKIKAGLDASWDTLEDAYKQHLTFDFAPRQGYYSDHIQWRQNTFMDALETMSTNLLQAYNDPNMVITVFGRPDLIRKIGPTTVDYTSPSQIGPVPLEFQRTAVTSNERVYQFISSQKFNYKYASGINPGMDPLDENQLMVVLNPRNTDRIMYRIYDYQMYVSNEIRNAANPTLPAVHAFERWKFFEYQPVQGRVTIENPSGLRA